jgi:hypothetical protein
LLDGWRTGKTVIGVIHAARQSDWFVTAGEHITTVDQHCGRPMEPHTFSVLVCLDLASIEVEAELVG